MSRTLGNIFTGVSFGFTSGVITTLGLILGLSTSTESKVAVIGGILTIAFADAMSDSLGMHVAKESEGSITGKSLWTASLATFFTKLVSALSFSFPFLFMTMDAAVLTSIIWGLSLLTAFSYFLAKETGEKPGSVIKEHVSISIVVIIASFLIGTFLKNTFK